MKIRRPSGIRRALHPLCYELATMSPMQFKTFVLLDDRLSPILYPGDRETAARLHAAGWTPEFPPVYADKNRTCPLMSWYWRRPQKKGGKRPGVLFYSPTQALNSLNRSQKSIS